MGRNPGGGRSPLKEKEEEAKKQVEEVECLEKEKELEWDKFEARHDKWKKEKKNLEVENNELNRQLKEALSEAQSLSKREQMLKEINSRQASEISKLSEER
ncbi:hypothetical protein GP486_000368 [Trichoglossum hirsutum]|uniref:Uncharacterized protein n=1 Tax=Trichoglossum hirsutum TaxID=265104 RepID=A0A9P8RTP8_9PEZI|nr:hypothetical protein GP486_000368 [Trichoglossum hirsutum]